MTQGGVKIAERLPQDHVVYAVTLRLSERAQQALTRTIWNDGIDIDVPSLDAKRFAWLIATPYIEELSRAEEQVRQLREALGGLLADIEDYQTINNLGGHNNQTQVNARAALASTELKEERL
jgi:hypothetical protein